MVDFQFTEEPHEYKLDSVVIPSVTQILLDLGIIRLVADEYLQRGTAVHKACELYDKSIPDESTITKEIQPYLLAWKQFLSDTQFIIDEIETPDYSNKYKYGFKIDRIGMLENKITILDIKTANVPNHLANKLQLVGYQLGYNERHKLEEYKATRRIAVHLKSSGTYKIEEYKDKKDINSWLSCLNVYNLKYGG